MKPRIALDSWWHNKSIDKHEHSFQSCLWLIQTTGLFKSVFTHTSSGLSGSQALVLQKTFYVWTFYQEMPPGIEPAIFCMPCITFPRYVIIWHVSFVEECSACTWTLIIRTSMTICLGPILFRLSELLWESLWLDLLLSVVSHQGCSLKSFQASGPLHHSGSPFVPP